MARINRYNSEPFGAPRRRERRSLLASLGVILLMAVSITLVIALLMAYATPYINPANYGSLTIVGIFAPMLYIMLVVCMMLWAIMQRWIYALVLLVVLLPGAFRISDFYNVNIHREVEPERDRRAFTLMSYNLRGFRDDSQVQRASDFVDYMLTLERMPDVVCLQELQRDARGIDRLDSLFDSYHSYQTVETEYSHIVTYSRYPIIRRGEIAGESRGTSQWCDVVVRQDTLRIFNNHLYTMNITSTDSNDISDGNILQDGDRMASIVRRIASNSAIRAEHVDTLRMVMDATPYEYVACGDFNDTPMSYVYRRMSRKLDDSFVEGGRGYGYTFRPMHSLLRIDYILHSRGLTTKEYSADTDFEMSDHLPITARIRVEQEDK